MTTWALFAILIATLSCGAAGERSAGAVELSATTLRTANEERLLPGRFEFRVMNGWMVRFDTAKGTYCAMENISDSQYLQAVKEYGRATADAALPGGGQCKD